MEEILNKILKIVAEIEEGRLRSTFALNIALNSLVNAISINNGQSLLDDIENKDKELVQNQLLIMLSNYRGNDDLNSSKKKLLNIVYYFAE